MCLILACAQPLGMQSSEIPESFMGSSYLGYLAHARPYKPGPYIKFADQTRKSFFIVSIFPYGRIVTAVAIFDRYSASFTLAVSDDSVHWSDYVINGNVVVSIVLY